jgi:hypothetical protein
MVRREIVMAVLLLEVHYLLYEDDAQGGRAREVWFKAFPIIVP